MGDKNIITKETKEGAGIWIIEIDKDKASKIEGATYRERLDNAINVFLDNGDSAVKPLSDPTDGFLYE